MKVPFLVVFRGVDSWRHSCCYFMDSDISFSARRCQLMFLKQDRQQFEVITDGVDKRGNINGVLRSTTESAIGVSTVAYLHDKLPLRP